MTVDLKTRGPESQPLLMSAPLTRPRYESFSPF